MKIFGWLRGNCMCRFNFVFLVILFSGIQAAAQDNKLLSFSYYNWSENMTVNSGGSQIPAPANLAAVGVQFDYMASNTSRGWVFTTALLTGSGTGGSTANTGYLASYQPFFGVIGSAAYFFKVEKRVYLELGPMILYRSLKWPEAAGITAASGADANFGMTANLRVRLFRNLDYCQSIGTLLSKATTIWSLGFGYRF